MKFEILTAMITKSGIFWEVKLCSLEQCSDVSENPAMFIITVTDNRGNTILWNNGTLQSDLLIISV